MCWPCARSRAGGKYSIAPDTLFTHHKIQNNGASTCLWIFAVHEYMLRDFSTFLYRGNLPCYKDYLFVIEIILNTKLQKIE